MSLLVDEELKKYLFPVEGEKSLVEGLRENDLNATADSAIQASSIDLSIGNIYIPGVKESARGGVKNGLKKHNLRPGATVIVESRETLNVPKQLAGLGFPPASVAVKGLLMTNAGHIDPGYTGKLCFTIINMSKEDFILVAGDKIFSILFFLLSGKVGLDIADRNKGKNICGGIKQDNLERLTQDFLDIENRTRRTVLKLSGIVTALITVLVGGFFSIIDGAVARHNGVDMERRLSQIESQLKINEYSGEIASFKALINELKQDLDNKNRSDFEKIDSALVELAELKKQIRSENNIKSGEK